MSESHEIRFFFSLFESVLWKNNTEMKSTKEIMNGSLIDIPREIPENIGEFDSHLLQICRYVTLRHEELRDGKEEEYFKDVTWKYIKRWVKFLLKPAPASFHFQEARSKDTTFYGGEGNIQPKSLKKNKEDDFSFPLREWLKSPENLTIQEFELAIAIFKWDGKKPVFANWVTERPYYLDRIHRFLLKRYCFVLLDALRDARKNASLDTPAHRAVEHGWIIPRLTGFVVIGLLAITGFDFFSSMFFFLRFGVLSIFIFALILLECYILYELGYMDVFKQNRPLLITREHARHRVLLLVWSTIWRSVLTSFIIVLFWGLLEKSITSSFIRPFVFSGCNDNALTNLVWPSLLMEKESFWEWMLRMGLGVTAMGTSAGLLGFLLQGFWEDTSALEPI